MVRVIKFATLLHNPIILMSTKTLSVTNSVSTAINGELQKEETRTVNIVRQIDSEPPFVKCYLRDISILNKIQRQTEAVMWELLSLMDYNSEISLSAGRKRELCRKLDFFRLNSEKRLVPSTNVVDQHIHRLVISKLFSRKDTGVYIANPHIFGKGKWGDIQNIRLQIDYSNAGKVVTADIQK